MDEIALPSLNAWPRDWQKFASRFFNCNIGVSRNILRKIAGLAPEIKETEIWHVHSPDDVFPLHANESITHLDFCSTTDASWLFSELRSYLRSPGHWPNLKALRVFKLKERPINSIVIYTPLSRYCWARGDNGLKIWDERLALKRKVLSMYGRFTLYVVDASRYDLRDPSDTDIGRCILAQRELLESKDGLKFRFARDQENGFVSMQTLDSGFVIPDEVGPVVAYDYTEDYRRWRVPKVVFIPLSLVPEDVFIEKCSRIRKMVSADVHFSVLVLDHFIGMNKKQGEFAIFKGPPPIFQSPIVKYHNPALQSFVQKQSLVGVEPNPPAPVKHGRSGLPLNPPSKRIFAWSPGTFALGGGGKQEKYISGGEATRVHVLGDNPHLLENKAN